MGTNTIYRRLSIGFFILVAILVIMAISAFYEFRTLTETSSAKNFTLRHEVELNVFNEELKSLVLPLNSYLITGNKKYKQEYPKAYSQVTEGLEKLESSFSASFSEHTHMDSGNFEQTLSSLAPKIEEMNNLAKKIFAIKDPVGSKEAADLTEELNYKYAYPIGKSLEAAHEKLEENTEMVHRDTDRTVSLLYYFIIFLVIGGIGSGIGISFYVSKDITNSLKEVTSTVSSASSQILSASEEQASGSSEQAASVSETTATIEELDQTAKQISANADAVVSVAENTLDSAKKGQEAIDDNIGKMEEIKTSSKTSSDQILALGAKSQEIGQVLEIINDIAEQTNLLALNASIEAARAGEAGKGFQVVASEIRKLAKNVIDSTLQIKDIVSELQVSTNKAVMSTEQSMIGVEKGAELSKKAGDMFYKILQMVEETTNAAKQISVATRQQRSASEQVVIAMKEVAEVSQQNAAATKQTTSSIQELNNLASDLQKMIKKP